MLERFLQFIKKHALLSTNDKLLVAVSGGVDSVVLCHLLSAAGYDYSIAHCNFKLRADASDKDEEFVSELAKNLSVDFYSTSFETRDYAKSQGVSTQMAARDLRYNWFEKLKQAHDFDLLLTAHHKNDIAETILLNLTRGTSINGVSGIPVSQNGVVRPLLSFTKSELLGFALNNKVKWREDASNKSVNYKRNKIRHEIVPLLEEINPSFLKQAERFAEKNKVVKGVFERHIESLRHQLLEKRSGVIAINKAKLVELSVSIFELEELLIPYGFNYDQAGSILVGLDGLTGSKFESPNHTLFLDRNELLIIEQSRELKQIELNKEDDTFMLDSNYKLEYKDAKGLGLDLNTSNAMLDASKLQYPMLLRPWTEGDKFKPLGMNGKKLISDFLIDEKVSSAEKPGIYVLESDGEIVWLIGHRISEDFKLSTETKEVLHIQRLNPDKSHS